MDIDDDKMQEAVEHTEILRAPKQSLTTFGTTNIIIISSPSRPTLRSSRIPKKRLSEKVESLQKNHELSPHTICPPGRV